jgi:CHASE3 domain sensor protein
MLNNILKPFKLLGKHTRVEQSELKKYLVGETIFLTEEEQKSKTFQNKIVESTDTVEFKEIEKRASDILLKADAQAKSKLDEMEKLIQSKLEEANKKIALAEEQAEYILASSKVAKGKIRSQKKELVVEEKVGE